MWLWPKAKTVLYPMFIKRLDNRCFYFAKCDFLGMDFQYLSALNFGECRVVLFTHCGFWPSGMGSVMIPPMGNLADAYERKWVDFRNTIPLF